MAKIDDLKQEATDLGIDFNANIGEAKLQGKIDTYYAGQETSGPAVTKAVKDKIEAATAEPTKVKTATEQMATIAKEIEDAARVTRIVTIVDNDQRVNNQTTTCTANCGNEHFDLGQLILPLNEPVEMYQGHIDVLLEVQIPMHTKDTKTGLSTLKMRSRYAVNDSRIKKVE